MNNIPPESRPAILLVDDHALVRRGIRTLLQIADPQLVIDEAGSVEEAVRLLETSDYRLSMIDLDLSGGQTGLDLLEKMHELGRGLPAIVLSGNDDRETVMRCLELGASGFITKASDDEDVFRKAIESVLEGRVYLPSSALGKGGHSTPFSLRSRSTALEDLNLKPSLKKALVFLYQGLSNKGIAQKMNISEFTARDYCSELYREFGVAKRSQLVVELARRGIALPDKTAA